MSDNFLTLIPISPGYVPDEDARETAERLFRSMLPKADEVESMVSFYPQFFGAYENFERVACPLCGADLDMDWWASAMDKAFEGQFTDLTVVLPCGCSSSLNDLIYTWPQGFARYGLKARNPDVRELSPDQISKLELAVGYSVRLIWAHI